MGRGLEQTGIDFPPQKMKVSGWLFLSVNEQIMRANSFKIISSKITTDIEVGLQPEEIKNPI